MVCRWALMEKMLYGSPSYSVKVEVEALEELLGPEDFRRILKEARDERGRNIFETFSSDGLSLLVAEWSRWDKYKRAPWRQDSSASASEEWWRERRPRTADSRLEPNGKKGDGCVGRLFGKLRPSRSGY